MQILQRKYPTQPMAPGKPEKREHEYIRHGGAVTDSGTGSNQTRPQSVR
jgi:hypothetical protein